MKNVLLATIALLLGVLFSLPLVELAVRILKRDVAFQADPQLIRSLRPNVAGDILSFETDDNLNGGSLMKAISGCGSGRVALG